MITSPTISAIASNFSILYVLVSSNDDIYLEQAYISMFSVKYYMPEVHIVLLIDTLTEQTLTGIRKNEVQYADEVISVELDKSCSAKERSRMLKTNARNYVKGDFLFIDTDTIVVKPLTDIDNLSGDILACWDTHSSFKENPYRDICLRDGRKLNWPIENEDTYFNSGVLFVRDTEKSHEFYDLWHKNWFEGAKVGVSMDQPAFAKTNYELGHVVGKLDDVWNCELKHGIRYLKDAKIVHYLCTNVTKFNNQQVFLLNEKNVLLDVKKTGIINDQIKDVIVDPFKGIAPVTHIFAGDDLYFFRTIIFKFLQKRFRTKLFSVVEGMLRILKRIKEKI